jgi:hypothetical protein
MRIPACLSTANMLFHRLRDTVVPMKSWKTIFRETQFRLLDVFPLATGNTHPIGKMQPVGFGAKIDRGNLLAVLIQSRPLCVSVFTEIVWQVDRCSDANYRQRRKSLSLPALGPSAPAT